MGVGGWGFGVSGQGKGGEEAVGVGPWGCGYVCVWGGGAYLTSGVGGTSASVQVGISRQDNKGRSPPSPCRIPKRPILGVAAPSPPAPPPPPHGPVTMLMTHTPHPASLFPPPPLPPTPPFRHTCTPSLTPHSIPPQPPTPPCPPAHLLQAVPEPFKLAHELGTVVLRRQVLVLREALRYTGEVVAAQREADG